MKAIIISVAMFVITILNIAKATVRTLNNNQPSPGQYTTWNAVQAVSSPGDTVYVSGSDVSYGDIIISITNLAIVGTGHHPYKQNPLVSRFGSITSHVEFMRVFGVKAETIIQQYYNGMSNTTIENCYTGIRINYSDYDAYVRLENNVLIDPQLTGTSTAITVLFNQSTSVLTGAIRNNLILGNISFQRGGLNCVIENNNFINYYSTGVLFYYVDFFSNTIFRNNIITRYSAFNLASQNPVFTNSSCFHNCIYSVYSSFNSLPDDSGTTIIADPLFINACGISVNYCPFSTVNDFHLLATSPCKNSGYAGGDIGMYGNNLYGNRFTRTGEPHISQITQMNMPSSGVSGTSFTVTVTSTFGLNIPQH